MPQDKLQGQGRPQRLIQRQETSHRGGMVGAHPQRDYRYSSKTTCGYCGSWPHRGGEDCKAAGQECHHCGRLRHFSKVCRQRSDYQHSEKTAVKHLRQKNSPQITFRVSTQPNFITNEQAKAPVNASRLQPEFTISKTGTQNTLGPVGITV